MSQVPEQSAARPPAPAHHPGAARPGRLLVAFGVVALVGGLLGGVLVRATTHSAVAAASTASGAVCDATSVAAEGLPSVVTISARHGNQTGTGSGEIIRSGGYILTNNHVVAVAADGGSVSVVYADGRSSEATIVGRDPSTDLAVLKAADGAPDLPVMPFGSSADLRVGQPVVALGAPLGLSSTVTSGIVSALNRYVPVRGDGGSTAHLVGAIQTDAAINPGNSGGALVDCAAQLVGVNSAIATVPNSAGQAGGGSVGLGFAIPADLAKPLSAELIATGRVSHPTFGLQVQTIAPSVAARAGVSPGLYVQGVTPGGPAAKAGLRPGDVITAVDGSPATSADALVVSTLTRHAGETVTVTYQRDGTTHTADVTLAAQG